MTFLLTTRFPRAALVAVALLAAACGDGVTTTADRSFLDGTETDPEIALVVNTLDRSLRMFQLGEPTRTEEVALGASSQVTPTGVAVRGRKAVVPLGNAASVALIDLEGARVERFFLFPSGNATGAVWVDDETVFVANLLEDYVGRFTLGQPDDAIVDTLRVAPAPTSLVAAGNKLLVVSGNLDESFLPLGEGIVTRVDPRTLAVEGTVSTGGTNPQGAALGPDGLLYVVNTGDYVSSGTLAVIDPGTMELVRVVEGLGAGPGAITIDGEGLAYVSGFFLGTVVYDTRGRSFLRGPDDPVCAPLAGRGCRGAFDAAAAESGRLYQAFFGSPSQGLPPRIFVYEPGTFALVDSVDAGMGPVDVVIRNFR